MTVWDKPLRYLFSLPFTSQAFCRTDLPIRRPTGLDALFQPRAWLALLCHPILIAEVCGIGFSTDFPSPTPFGLGLGPGLPWADEPSPGILRFSAGRILTCLFAYLYRHSHFRTLHCSFRYSFYAYGTLSYPGEQILAVLCLSLRDLLQNFLLKI